MAGVPAQPICPTERTSNKAKGTSVEFIENNLMWIAIAAAAVVVVVVAIIIAVVVRRRRKAGEAIEEKLTAGVAEDELERPGSLPDEAYGGMHAGKGRKGKTSFKAGGSAAPAGSDELTAEDLEMLLDEPEFETLAQQRVRTVEGAFNSETRYVSIDAPASCGFNFNHVVSGYSTRAGSAPGADSTDAQTVYAAMRNFDKIKADLVPIRPLFSALTAQGASAIYRVSFPDIEGMIELLRPFGERSVALRGVENLALITIEGRSADGSLKEFPVTVRAVTVRRGGLDADSTLAAMRDSLVLDLSYVPDGSIAKGRIVRWRDRAGYLCEFEWDAFADNYLPTVVKVTDTPGKWQTVFGR